jgi:hypothetical protein
MRPQKENPEPPGDQFRSRLEQIISIRHELGRLAGEIKLAIYRPRTGSTGPRSWPTVSPGSWSRCCFSRKPTACQTKVSVSAGSTTHIFNASPAKSSSHTTCRTSAFGISGSVTD